MTATINIPFSGFYNSLWSSLVEVDSEVEQFAEYAAELQESRKYHPEEYHPEELRVDVSHWAWEMVNYSAAHLEIAKDYAAAFGAWLDERARDIDPDAPPCELTFASMDSPREYNFRTDEIDAEISESFVAWMRAQAEAGGECAEPLADAIRRRHSSRSGFISFYANDLRAWPEDVESWDCRQLRTLLESVFGVPNELEDIYDMVSGNSYDYFTDHFKWKEYESRVTEERAEKLAEWLDSDPEKAGAWMAHNPEKAAPLVALLPADFDLEGLPYRCQKTPDLFTGMT